MSQKTQIRGVKHTGAHVYLGDDSQGNPLYTKNPERILNWLSDGWRSRYNQYRAVRTKRQPLKDKKGNTIWVDLPLGGSDAQLLTKKSETRAAFSWLRGLPDTVLSSPAQVEATDWFSSVKALKTNRGKGRKYNLPGFKSKHTTQRFVGYYSDGRNCVFQKTGRRTGILTIKGQTPKAHKHPQDARSKWQLKIRVRTSQEIRPYTSVVVDLLKRTVVFVNSPVAVPRKSTGSVVGIDRGVVHTLTTSNGEFFDIPKPLASEAQRVKRLQRRLSKQVKGSHRREITRKSLSRIFGYQKARRSDWIHKTTRTLIEDHDLLVLENLQTMNMTKGGGAHKRGLNRAILQNSWSDFLTTLQYKAKYTGNTVKLVNPSYTSQTCNKCGYISRENRESQALFSCTQCNHVNNADVNAALNILDLGLGYSLGRGDGVRPDEAAVDSGTVCEASTTALVERTSVFSTNSKLA